MANEISHRATSSGSALHKIVEDYLSNKNLSEHKALLPRAHFMNIKQYIDRIDNIRVLEGTLWSDFMKIAGRVDCIAEFDHVPSVIDFKTSKKEKKEEWILKYFLQETCYSLMFKERTGFDYEQIVTIISCEDGNKQLFVKNRKDYIDELNKVLQNG